MEQIIHPDDVEQQLVRRGELLDQWLIVTQDIARLEALKASLLAERLDLTMIESATASAGDMPFRSMVAEYSAAGHLPQGTVERQITDAWALVHLYPMTHQALSAGAISRRHADVILESAPALAGSDDADAIRAAYEAQVVPFAAADTAARTRVHARGVAAQVSPRTLTELHQHARGDRSITVTPDGDGMAVLTAFLPEILAYAVHDRLTSIARVVRGERSSDTEPNSSAGLLLDDDMPVDDTRTMDQLRADIFSDLLLTADPSAVRESAAESIRATVHVTIAASSLAGLDQRPGEFEGHGPLSADAVRVLAGYASSWDRLFLDPTGLTVSTDSYVPTAAMKRFLRARDQHCRFPGCRAPAHRCQIDHNHDHALGGPTAIDNLALFCTSHHPLKHPDLADADRWTADQLAGGVIVWTSPLGRRYTDEPALRVMFV